MKKNANAPLNLKLNDDLIFSISMHDVLFGTYLFTKKKKLINKLKNPTHLNDTQI